MQKKPKNRKQLVHSKLPNLNKLIVRYLETHNINGPEIESLTGIHRNIVYYMRKDRAKTYVDTIYMFSIALGENFFAPLLELLYLECPELKKQDPLYQELQDLKSKCKLLQEKVDTISQKPSSQNG